MWIPTSEGEIMRWLTAGSVSETATFDAKQQLPPPGKNKDLARDLCAMTVDGGALLYGIGGADRTRPDTPTPLDLAGASERIDQVAQTAISESPLIEIHDVPSDTEPGRGYLTVLIPSSPRAPHMVTLDGDNRYYGRGATGNRILNEGEVARLYARRERWERDRDTFLDDLIVEMPFSYADPVEQIGPMLVATRPVGGPLDLLIRAWGNQDPNHFLQMKFTERARETDPYPNQGTSGLGEAIQTSRRGADVWVLSAQTDTTIEYQARAELHRNGQVAYWHSPTINHHQSRLLLMEQSVTRATTQTIATAGWLYDQANYFGAVDVAVALLHIAGASGASLHYPMGSPPSYRRARIPSTRAHAYDRDASRPSLDRPSAPGTVVRRCLS
jgi:hypothetical protein